MIKRQQKKELPLYRKQIENGLRLSGSVINFLALALGIAAAYFMTIQSLKIELADKAEDKTVSILDKKLTNLEVILKEGVVSKEEFFRFSNEIEARLSRIEYYLTDHPGEKIGEK